MKWVPTLSAQEVTSCVARKTRGTKSLPASGSRLAFRGVGQLANRKKASVMCKPFRGARPAFASPDLHGGGEFMSVTALSPSLSACC